MSKSKIKKRKSSPLRRRARRYFTKKTLFWLFIIVLCSVIMSAFIGTTSVFFERIYKRMDGRSLPLDTDKETYEHEQQGKTKK